MLWLVLAAVIAIFVYLKVIKPYNYWNDRGIVCERSWPVFGIMMSTLLKTKPFMEVIRDSYRTFPDERYYGYHQFRRPVLMIRDLDLIKRITVKDFDHFTDHNPFVSEEADPFMGRSLFSLKGQRWREMRATLSPSFTGSKMRGMFTLLSECAQQFTQYYEKVISDKVVTCDMRDIFTRFTNDAIASTAFGLKVDSLEERDNEFYLMGKETSNFTGWRTFRFLLLFNLNPKLCRYFNLTFFPENVSAFFRRIIKETVEQREQQGLVRPDMIHLLMEARKGRLKHESHPDTIDTGFATAEESQVGKVEKHQKQELSIDDITAQALLFFLGGFETSSNIMAFTAHELAVNPDIQKKLQAEIDATFVKYNGQVTYETLMEMKYLDMVVSETLRKWPPGFQLDRVCVKDYVIQPERPHEKPITLEKGQMVVIPVVGIHHNPTMFPNPEKFDPERFSDENKHKIEPASYMPFGAGPRNCIASRFALLENKVLFFHLLSKFDIEVVEKTTLPVRVGKKPFSLIPDEGMFLGLRKRTAA